MIIRYLRRDDFDTGFFGTLSNLTEVGPIATNRHYFNTILDNLDPIKQHIFVAVEEEKVIGTASILIEQKIIHNGGFVGHIEDVVVHKDHQGKRIGSLLIDKCIDVAKSFNCYKIILDCSPSNVKFYQKNGFKENSICMRLDLI
jgi:glucosamine-phosphate N-acetyltransferase